MGNPPWNSVMMVSTAHNIGPVDSAVVDELCAETGWVRGRDLGPRRVKKNENGQF